MFHTFCARLWTLIIRTLHKESLFKEKPYVHFRILLDKLSINLFVA